MSSEVILRHFDVLVEQGLKPIPLKINSKQPYGAAWNKDWNAEKARWYFRCEPTLNMGILLGDVVDVEGDTPAANERINNLIGNYPHPSYRSLKSTHHLFLTPDPKLTRITFNDIEYRGHNHQSVLPPSQHQGTFYRWNDNSVWPVPPMPDKLVDLYWHRQRDRKRKNTIKPGHIKVWCAECQKERFLHEKRWASELEVFRLLSQRWTCQSCRQIDLRPLVRRLRRGQPILPAYQRKAG